MLLKHLGGEFALINRIAKDIQLDANVIKGIGDDCAVIKKSETEWQLITTDMMVENDHFNVNWSTPFQIGMKLMECNVSDIVAMGGRPEYAVLSVSLKKDTTVEFMDDFINGLKTSAIRHKVILLGGDTTHGNEMVFNLALTGSVSPNNCRFRSGAKPGDLIAVTGMLGGSTAGLKLLLKGKNGDLKTHLEPRSRLVSEGETIAQFATAMIDVSDGLASEVTHIATESKTGARIDHDLIPLSTSTRDSAAQLDLNPYDFALYGGEDFELVFTLPPAKIEPLRKQFSDFTIVGEILPQDQGIYLFKNGKREELKKGYDHFG